jgi:hypothetical protein
MSATGVNPGERTIALFARRPAPQVHMLADQFHAAAAVCSTYAALNAVSADLWRAHGSGLIPDDAAQAAAEAIQARRRALGAKLAQRAENAPTAFSAPRRAVPRSPDREASIRRRRSVAASGALPSRIACQFTQAENAVLSVIATECRRCGSCCSWPVDRIAALAGVSRRTAQYAIRAAERLGLIAVKARPRPGAKSDTNIIRIVSRDWIAWLKRSGHRVQINACLEYELSKSVVPQPRLVPQRDLWQHSRRRYNDTSP